MELPRFFKKVFIKLILAGLCFCSGPEGLGPRQPCLPENHPSSVPLPAAQPNPRTRRRPVPPAEPSDVWTATFSGGMQRLSGTAPSAWNQISQGWRVLRWRWGRSRHHLRSVQRHSEAGGNRTRRLLSVHLGCGIREDKDSDFKCSWGRSGHFHGSGLIPQATDHWVSQRHH